MLNIPREQVDEILKGVVWSEWPVRAKRGQQVNWMPTGTKLTHPDWRFEVSCCELRTQAGNRQTCILLFELFLLSL